MPPVFRSRAVVCLLYLICAQWFSFPAGASAQIIPAQPSLSATVAPTAPGTLVTVTGDGFTEGGLVFIAIHNQWGNSLPEVNWTVASVATHGTNGSQDPAQGYRSGGIVSDAFDLKQEATYGPNGSMDPAQGFVPASSLTTTGECGVDLTVRAYDHESAIWSNTLDVSLDC